ncbi:MAG: MBOAT family O-acyltransferase, partial [Pseudomonadota bacterium]
MLFSDPAYLFLFFPLVVAGAALVARVARTEAVLTFLFLASCLFYVGWGVDYLVTMLASILVNWLAAHLLLRLEDGRRALRRGIFLVGLAANLGALIYFKYAFYFDVWAPEAGSAAAAPSFEPGLIAIPVGISFYTFQQIVFLQDALRRDTHVVDYIGAARGMGATAAGFIRYASFVAFFPQLVIGPIVYLSEFAPQVQRRGFGLIRRADLEIGLFIFVVGLFKKIVVADNLAYIVDPVFEAAGAGEKIGTLAAWAAAFGYYAQLYFDFSGYSDMALGSARMLGIVLPINFASPLKADSISDYYKRWHVTLTRVIARFLYTPLSLWGARVA